MSQSKQVIGLFRDFLRSGKSFKNYNLREYVLRKTREQFRKNMQLTDSSAINDLIVKAKKDLEVCRRQAVISTLYEPALRSVMDLKPAAAEEAVRAK